MRFSLQPFHGLLLSFFALFFVFSTRCFFTFSAPKWWLGWSFLLLFCWQLPSFSVFDFVRRNRYFCLCFVYSLGVMWFSSSWGVEPANQWFFFLLCWVVLIVWFQNHVVPEKHLFCVLLICGTVLSGWVLFQGLGTQQWGVHKITASIGNPNRLGGLLYCLLAFLFCFSVDESLRKIRWVVGLLLFVALGMTQCKSAILCAVLFFVFYGWQQTKSKTKKIVFAVCLLVFFGSGVGGLFPKKIQESILLSAKGRMWIHSISSDLWKKYFFWGVGFRSFPKKYLLLQAQKLEKFPKQRRFWTFAKDPHHLGLYVAISLGFVGLLIFCGWLFRLFWLLWHKKQKRVLALCVCFLPYCWVESVLLAPSLCWLCLVLFAFWTQEKQDGSPIPTSSFLSLKTWLFFFCCLGFFQESRFLLASFFLRQGIAKKNDIQASSLLFSKGLVMHPQEPFLLFYQGLLAWERSSFSQAEWAWKKAFSLQPTPEMSLALSNLFFAQNDPKQAILFAQKAIWLHPRYSKAYFALGKLYETQNLREKAFRYYQRAFSLQPKNPMYREHYKKTRPFGKTRKKK